MFEKITCQNLKKIFIQARRISCFGGLGVIEIINDNGNYFMSYSFEKNRPNKGLQSENSKEMELPPELVRELIDAINSPPVKKSQVLDFDLLLKWLILYEDIKEVQINHFNTVINWDVVEKLKSEDYLQKKLVNILWQRSYGLNNSYPRMNIEIYYGNDQKIEISSNVNKDFMVPWEVKFGEEKFSTANIKIPLAIVKIAPKGFINVDRLSGIEFMMERLGKNKPRKN